MNDKKMMAQEEKKNIWLLIAGMGVSRIGTLAFSFAVGLYILNMTGSGMSFAISMILGALPRVLISPIAGIVADKYPKKRIIVCGDLISGSLVLLLLFQAEISIMSLYVIIGTLAIVNTFFDTAVHASLANLVEDDHLMYLNSRFEAFRSVASIIGPMVGGILFGFGTLKLIIMINGVSFVLSGISELFIDFKYNSNLSEEEMKEKKSFAEVKTYLKEEPIFIYILGMSLSFNFLLTMGVNVPHTYMMNNVLRLSPRSIGFVEATISIGIILGSIVVAKMEMRHLFKPLYLGSMGLSLSVALTGVPYLTGLYYTEWINVLYQAVVLLIAGFSLAVINVPVGTKMQQMVPEKLRGRLFSLFGMIGSALIPVGLMLSGFLIQYILPQYIMVVCGLVMMVTTVFFLTRSGIRSVFDEELSVEIIEET